MAVPRVAPEDVVEHRSSIDPDLANPEPATARNDPRRHATAQRTILLVIGSAGALGALARYAVARLVTSPAGHFPWSTFWINVTGSFAIGLVLVLVGERFRSARIARPLIATGFLGAYTTFSTYMVDSDLLFRRHDFATGALYVAASLFAGLGAAFAGVVLARFLVALDRRLNELLG